MSQALLVGLIGLVLFNGQAVLPGEDDWEYAEDAARGLSMAVVRYDDGKAVIARCQSGELKLVIAGLPATVAGERVFDATRADGRMDRQSWTAEADGTLVSNAVGRDSRFVRGGGLYQLRSAAGQASPMRAAFDLPTQNASLDRVMTACGWALQDDRDTTPRTPQRVAEPAAEPRISARRRRELEEAPIGWIVDLNCIVRDLKMTECRVDHELPAGREHGEAAIELTEGDALTGLDAAAAEATVTYLRVTTQTVMREALISSGR